MVVVVDETLDDVYDEVYDEDAEVVETVVLDADSEEVVVETGTVDDEDAKPAFLYTLRRFPAPQVSETFPGHLKWHSVASVGTLPSLNVLPQKH